LITTWSKPVAEVCMSTVADAASAATRPPHAMRPTAVVARRERADTGHLECVDGVIFTMVLITRGAPYGYA
jgi:hypothetical protein